MCDLMNICGKENYYVDMGWNNKIENGEMIWKRDFKLYLGKIIVKRNEINMTLIHTYDNTKLKKWGKIHVLTWYFYHTLN